MSFIMDSIRSIARNHKLGRNRSRGIQTTGLPSPKATGKILEPASALVVKQFQEKLARERKQEQIITTIAIVAGVLLTSSLFMLLFGNP
ncbi:MAG: hypothetical protein AAGJ93_11445 [Bacteroidota bacterium]